MKHDRPLLPAADVRATRVSEDASGLHATIETPAGPAELELRLAGRFNVHNALAVVALGEVLGLDAGAVRTGLAGVDHVPGRMERIDEGKEALAGNICRCTGYGAIVRALEGAEIVFTP